MSIVRPQMQTMPIGQVASPGASWTTFLVLGGIVAGGFLLWKAAQSEEAAEAAEMPGFWVDMYDTDDDRSYAGEGWEPKFQRHFARRSDAEAYKQEQGDYFDLIEIREVTA